METVDRACRTAQLLGGELPKVVDSPRASGVGLDRPEFDDLVTHELARLLSDHPRLTRAACQARSAPDNKLAWSSVQCEMEQALRRDPGKLEALWVLLEAAGQPPPPVEASSDDPSPRHPGRSVRRWTSAVVAPLGAAVAVILMAALAGLAILGDEIDLGPMLLRWFVVVVLSCLPGWMFLRFIVFRAGSLWTEYVLHLHRLGMDDHPHLPPPPMSSGYYHLWSEGGGSVLSGAANVYQQKFEAYYGKFVGTHDADRRKPVLDKTISQVLLATAVLAVGWTAVLARQPLFPDRLDLPLDTLRFAFMGAYVFILQMLIRRFFQSDLKASAYLGAVARIVTVLIIVLVVHEVLPVGRSVSAGTEVGLAFLIGFFPLLGMQVLQKAVSLTFRKFIPTLRTPYPLSDLDGLNIWYEARLLEEGIEDMQNLITGNLVDIILHTRVPVGRLVDWLDQAALQLLLDAPTDNDKKRPTRDRCRLRRLGIRTATDLEAAFLSQDMLACHASRSAVRNFDDAKLVDGIRGVLNDDTMPGVNVTEALLKAFCNIPNLVHVRHWRDILSSEHAAIHSGAGPVDAATTNGSHPG